MSASTKTIITIVAFILLGIIGFILSLAGFIYLVFGVTLGLASVLALLIFLIILFLTVIFTGIYYLFWL